MDLYGAGGAFRFATGAWKGLLYWAQIYGWQPTMTGAPLGMKRDEWIANCRKYNSTGYLSNDGQLFYARDALKLAEALERLLLDMQGREFEDNHEYSFMLSEERQNQISLFIDYCRKGSFRIG